MSDPVKRDPILDQFSMITRPYTRPNGLNTIPFPATIADRQFFVVKSALRTNGRRLKSVQQFAVTFSEGTRVAW